MNIIRTKGVDDMCTVNVTLDSMERRRLVKAARVKGLSMSQLLKKLAFQQLGAEIHESDSISENEKWEIFMKGVNGFTEDFMPDGRDVEIPTKRGVLCDT